MQELFVKSIQWVSSSVLYSYAVYFKEDPDTNPIIHEGDHNKWCTWEESQDSFSALWTIRGFTSMTNKSHQCFFHRSSKETEKCAISTILTNGEEILLTRFSFREALSHLPPQGRDCTPSSVSLVSKDGQDASSLPRILLASASTRMLFAHRLGRTGHFRALVLLHGSHHLLKPN